MIDKILIADVCGTLYCANTTIEFIEWLHGKDTRKYLYQYLRKHSWIKFVNLLVRHVIGKDILRDLAIKSLAGMKVDALKIAALEFVTKALVNQKNETVTRLVGELRSEGYELMLGSGSIDLVIEPIAKEWNAIGYLCTSLEQKGDYLTGRISRDLSGNKHEVIKNKIAGIRNIVVITDNKTDLQLLKLASRAFVVAKGEKQRAYWKRKKLATLEFV